MNNNLPKVSIVLPTYNGSKYIRQSIDSCLNQTYKIIELIIVDDASNDITPEIIKSYEDERISCIRHEKNKGLPYALNTGFTHATGEYLTWTSDDNMYAKEAIEKMLYFLITNHNDFVYCDYYSFNDDDIEHSSIVRLPTPVTFKYINGVRACFLYSKKVKEVVGDYDKDTQLVEDYDYWIRVSKKFSMQHLDEPLYYYRVHKASLYSSRFYEVEIVKLLVRLKYNIIDIKEFNFLFRDLIVRKKNKFFIITRALAKILLTKKIGFIIKRFKMQEDNFIQTRQYLQRIFENWTR